MTRNPRSVTIASGVLGFVVAVVWVGAPLLPALVGAGVAGWLLYRREQRRQR